ncbi:hypothetical protein HY971_00530 [Candidatus Kaiserbacteria bacterium]|nr:hypothetical protein [Candidatus Kaiserbacteria bacterium]
MSEGGGGDGGGDGGLADFFWGTTNTGPRKIPHYYGDSVRQLLLGAAALMIISSPLYTNTLRREFPLIVIAALAAAALSAIINPRDRWIPMATALLSGVGLVSYAMWGMFQYENIGPLPFILRMAIAVIFLFAFYFSMKTLRAFMLHQIGKRETIDEFEEPDEKIDQEMLEREQMLNGKQGRDQ